MAKNVAKELSSQEAMIEIGRENGRRMMQSAIEDAETQEQMHNQMKVCEHMGIHMLATLALNRVKQDGVTWGRAIEIVTDQILSEYTWLKLADERGEIKMVKP